MALRLQSVATIACTLTLLAPQAGAAAFFTSDPARDIVVTRNSATIPVDSIDILGYSYTERHDALRAASLTVSDLSRRGLEDRLFVQSAHAYRAYGYTQLNADNSALTLVAVQVDSDPELRVAAFHIWPGGHAELPVKFSMDEANGILRWRLQQPFEGVASQRFVTTMLFGCDDDETCQPGIPKVMAFDMAPNDLAQPLYELVPPTWWAEIVPEDDGTVPPTPVSLAALAKSATA